MFAKLHRRRLVKGRAPLSDDEFVSRVGVRPELHYFIVAAREAVARVCRVPSSFLFPEDKPESIVKLVTFDWDDLGVVMEMEGILGFAIGDEVPRFIGWRFFWRGEPGPKTFGAWCVRVAEYIHSTHAETHVG